MNDYAEPHPLTMAMHEVLKAVRLLKQNRAGHPAVVPVGTVGVLAAIRNRERAGPCHVKDLANDHALDPSTISRTVAALVRAGLVARSADPDDGRAITLHLTHDGCSVLDSVQQHYQDRLTTALHNWSPEEIAEFAAALHRFARDLIDQENTTPSLEAAR
ncbi:MarR family winged helix-turn-helix transcriptional regulator [Actinoplanes sp. GCM10030250]|uniref:MarR family winged helix-turn-helix transcriptional regulator n=1 Tax=Actinoplanes sp. GCM10030250 TaxID=3273376 RepID=UPI00360B487E